MNLIWQKQNWMIVFASLLYQLFPSNVDEIGVWSCKILQTATLPPVPTSTPQPPEFKVRAHHNPVTTSIASTEVSHKCICANRNPAYVTIKIDNQKFAKTSQEINCVWNQTFQIHCANPADSCITITLKASCSFVLGKFDMQAHQLLKKGGFINGFFPILMDNGKPNPKLKLKF
ncbi:hypothetical protein JHK85_006651 [Glycine max]|nr:hypothetical protein JHK85_006651 [Glycine max]